LPIKAGPQHPVAAGLNGFESGVAAFSKEADFLVRKKAFLEEPNNMTEFQMPDSVRFHLKDWL
jgi:hypothetical protein